MKIDTYGEAFNSHRHYDVMATTLFGFFVTLIAASISAYLYIRDNFCGLVIPYLLVILLLTHYCIDTYRRFDRYAVIALNLAGAIERGDGRFTESSIGFAMVFKEIESYPEMDQKSDSTTFIRIKIIAALFYFSIITALIYYINRLIM